MKVPPQFYSETSLAAYFKVSRGTIRWMRENGRIDPKLMSKSRGGGLWLFDKALIHDRLRRLADLYKSTPADRVEGLPQPVNVLLPIDELARQFAPTTDPTELAKLAQPVAYSIPEVRI